MKYAERISAGVENLLMLLRSISRKGEAATPLVASLTGSTNNVTLLGSNNINTVTTVSGISNIGAFQPIDMKETVFIHTRINNPLRRAIS